MRVPKGPETVIHGPRDHLRVDLHMDGDCWRGELADAVHQAQAIGCALALASNTRNLAPPTPTAAGRNQLPGAWAGLAAKARVVGGPEGASKPSVSIDEPERSRALATLMPLILEAVSDQNKAANDR